MAFVSLLLASSAAATIDACLRVVLTASSSRGDVGRYEIAHLGQKGATIVRALLEDAFHPTIQAAVIFVRL